MNLLKTSFLTGISTVIRVITAFIVNKIVAVYIGPSGLALIGQFQNFITIIMTFSNGAINSGIVKYTAEYYDDPPKRSKMLSTALLISVVCSIVVSLILIIFNQPLAISLLKDVKYSSIFIIFGFTLVIFSLNTFFVSVLNGYKEIKKFISLNIVSSIVGLIFTSVLVLYWGLYGALLSYVTAQTVVFIVTIFFVIKSEWFNIKDFMVGYNWDNVKKLGKFSLMAIITALTVPVSQILIRNYIVDEISLDAAGYWQGVWRISDVYLMLVTTPLSVYYLPRLAEIKDTEELRKEIFSGYKIIMPIIILMAIGIYIFKVPIIELFFTEKFMQMKDLFTFQLIGDVIKIASWLLGFIMVAKAMTRYFVATEIIFSITFVVLSMFFINKFGLIGVTQAFALNYFLYSLAMFWLFKSLIFNRSKG